MKYDFCIVITTYNRENMLKDLLTDIFTYGKDYNLYVVVFDDSSEKILDLEKFDIKYIRYSKNNGKHFFWKIFQDSFNFIKNINADYYLYLQDDSRLKPNFFIDSVKLYNKIEDNKKICLSTLIYESHRNVIRWVQVDPILLGEYYLTQWVETFFICKKKFFEVLEYKMNPIPLSRWAKNKLLSSGVGQQISQRLFDMGFNMYVVYNSLVTHDDHLSVMNPEDRQKIKLISI